MKTPSNPFLLATLVAVLGACGGEDASDLGGASPPGTGGGGATGVGQSGAQDFGLFRQILEAGEIPSPDTLDDIGFFAEHKLDYPQPTCENDLCIHGLAGAMGNMISGADCTILQVGMNSPLQVDPDNRPPMHLVLALDVSGSMSGQPIQYLRTGLDTMVGELRADDTVSLVTYSSEANIVLEAVPATDTTTLRDAFAGLSARGNTNLYDGLFTALRIAADHQSPDIQNRVIFLSDGVATTGLKSASRLRSLAESYARLGIAITTIGVGEDFDVEVMRGVGQVGAGNFYFLANPSDVTEVFADEVHTFLSPIALDVEIEVLASQPYKLRAGYGARTWERVEGGAVVQIPALYLAGRTSAQAPIEEGRRGGGGAIIFELVSGVATAGPTEIGSIAIRYTDPKTGEARAQLVNLDAPHLPGQAPPEGWFGSFTSEKAFVMLNIFAGFQMATELTRDADPRTALAVLEALRASVQEWLSSNEDPDITDDLYYIDLFIENLLPIVNAAPSYPTPPPPNPWPAD